MCGIVGIVRSNKRNAETDFTYIKAMELMLYLDQVRGFDSTGIVNLSTGNTVKEIGTPDYLLCDPDVWNNHMIEEKIGWIGHNRWATKGEVNVDNAHPFVHNHIAGVHNGTLTSTSNLLGHGKFDTDSETVYHNMSIEGELETLKKVQGPYCFVWYNADDLTLNFARNTGRPMSYALGYDDSLYYMSDESHLEVVLKGMKISARPIKSLSIHTHYKLDLTSKNFKFSETPYTPEIEYVKPSYNNYSGYYRSDYSDVGRNNSASSELISSVDDLKLKHDIGRDDEVKFKVSKVTLSPHDKKYCIVEGTSEQCPDCSIRVYRAEASKYLNQPVGSMLKGNVSSAWNEPKHGAVVSLTASTLLTVIDNLPTATYRMNGVYVGLKEWEERTKTGCSMCTGNLFKQEHEDILWLDINTPVCPSCVERESELAYH